MQTRLRTLISYSIKSTMLSLLGPPLDGRVHEKLAPFIEAATQKGIGHIVYISDNYISPAITFQE